MYQASVETNVEAKIEAKIDEVKQKLQRLGMPVDFTYAVKDLGVRIAGQAYLWRKHIELCSRYLQDCPDETINVTLPHEIAHLVQATYYPKAKQAHGPEWKQIMRLLGLPGNRCSSMQLIPKANGTKLMYEYRTEDGLHQAFVGAVKHRNMQKQIRQGSVFSIRGSKIRFVQEVRV